MELEIKKKSQKERVLLANTLINNILAEIEEGESENILNDALDLHLSSIHLIKALERRKG